MIEENIALIVLFALWVAGCHIYCEIWSLKEHRRNSGSNERYEPTLMIFAGVYVFWAIFLVCLGYIYMTRYAIRLESGNDFIIWSFIAITIARLLPDYYLHIKGRRFIFSKKSILETIVGYVFLGYLTATFVFNFLEIVGMHTFFSAFQDPVWPAFVLFMGALCGAICGIGLYLSGEVLSLLEREETVGKRRNLTKRSRSGC